MKIDPRRVSPSNRYLIVYEIMFCDYELDPKVRKNFVEIWLANLERMARFVVPPRCDVRFVVYLSEDKVEEKLRLENLIKSIEPEYQNRFISVSYTHPSNGYGFTKTDHPDLWKNPNKVAPRRDELFARAIPQLPLDAFDRIIRGSIDDDDFLFSWQFSQFVQAAEIAYEEGKIIGVGLGNEIVAYAGKGRADVVTFSHHMHGNKFYVASRADFDKLAVLSPWSIPERFDEANTTRLERAGATLKEVKGGLPGYVYCRWGHNLSLQDKSNYYLKVFEEISFESVEELVNSFEEKIGAGNNRTSLEFPPLSLPPATPPFERFSALSAYVPTDSVDPTSQYFLILKSREGKTLHSQKISPSRPIPLAQFAALAPNADDIFGFIQKRNADGSREVLPGRGRITNIDYLRRLGLQDWSMSRKSATSKLLSRLETALAASTWIQDEKFPPHINSIIKELDSNSQGVATDELLIEFVLENFDNISIPVRMQLERLRNAMGCYRQSSDHFLPAFSDSPLSEGINELENFPLKLAIDYRPNPGKPLIVVLHGRKAENVRLPYLPGRGITNQLDVAFLSISDPTFYLSPDLSIGWHSGSIKWPSLQQDLARFIKSVAEKQNSSKIVFVGGSAGGFASLILSRLIEGSNALVWNPQTDVFKYYRRFVEEYLEKAWDGNDPRPSLLHSPDNGPTFNACEFYGATTPTNTVVYLQEETDAHHINEHFTPFKNACSGTAGLYQFVSHWGDGHAPAPKALIVDFLKALTSPKPTDSIAKLGALPL